MLYGRWQPVIGLEIHAQLLTKSKLFSTDSAAFGAGDNEHTTPVSLGLPGTLPVLNQKAVELSTKIGLALNCKIKNHSVFSRKNYFYPDLPKGYQISQYDQPIAEGGFVEVFVADRYKKVGITRAHIEEDAGKSTHHGDHSLINLNRAGVPLLEIVSDPEIETPEEAAEYARSVRRILRYLEVCDGNLEEGSMRCDCNVSVRPVGQEELGTKVEIKNINSFRFVEKAIEYEIQRQIDTIEAGEKIVQETRLYDSAKNKTYSMRSKEEAHDYRYFPEPDLLPLVISEETIALIRKNLPELPMARAKRFHTSYGLSESDARALTQEKGMADYFEATESVCKNPKAASNWIMGDFLRQLNEQKIEFKVAPVQAEDLGQLITMIDEKKISGKIGKAVFLEMWTSGKSPEEIVESKGLVQISDSASIEKIVTEIVEAHPAQAEEYRQGKVKLIGFFVGQIMKVTKGQANPDLVNQILKEKLKG